MFCFLHYRHTESGIERMATILEDNINVHNLEYFKEYLDNKNQSFKKNSI